MRSPMQSGGGCRLVTEASFHACAARWCQESELSALVTSPAILKTAAAGMLRAFSTPLPIPLPRSSPSAPLRLGSARRSLSSRRRVATSHRCASPLPGRSTDAADHLRLSLDVCEETKVPDALQPLHDEGPEHDLHAHRKLEGGRRLPRQDPDSVQDVLRKKEENPGLALEHFRPRGNRSELLREVRARR